MSELKGGAVKYLILIYGNSASRHVWNAMPHDERVEGLKDYAALRDDLVASGEMIVSEALTDPSEARRVPAAKDTLSADGPFAEVKEYLAGFFLIECASIERAMEHAGRIPEAAYGLVEVRPVREFIGPDM
jgi:hypothetical protein